MYRLLLGLLVTDLKNRINPSGLRWFWIWIGIMPTCPNPEALQRLALSSHCRNLLKCPASKTVPTPQTSRKRFATKKRVKHTILHRLYDALSLLSKKQTNSWTWNIKTHTIQFQVSWTNGCFKSGEACLQSRSQDGYKDIRLLLYFIYVPLEWFLLLKRLVPPNRTLPASVVQSNKR